MKKFFETTFTVRVLSEDVPVDSDVSLETLAYLIDEGPCVGRVTYTGSERLTGAATSSLLTRYGSEPGFFQLDAAGRALGGEEEDDDVD